MAVYASKMSIIKGNLGAAQFSMIPPTWEAKENPKTGAVDHKVTKEGSILIEMAPFLKEENGNKYYDWANKKVSFGLGIPDIAKLLTPIQGELKLTHQLETQNKTKLLSVKPGEGEKYQGTFMMSLMEIQGESKMSSRISFDAGEWAVFLTLLRTHVSTLLGWDRIGQAGNF